MGPRESASVPGALPRFLIILVAAATVATFLHYVVWAPPPPPFRAPRHGGSAELHAMLSPTVLSADTVYLIPGGGSDRGTYPEWSKQRTLAAFEHSKQYPNSVFLALSAGSLNAPNGRLDDGRVRFECQAMVDQLVDLGVPRERVFGDFMSWDTVANALVCVPTRLDAIPQPTFRHLNPLLSFAPCAPRAARSPPPGPLPHPLLSFATLRQVARQFVEALLSLPPPTQALRGHHPVPLRVEVIATHASPWASPSPTHASPWASPSPTYPR